VTTVTSVIAIDLSSGDRTILSDGATGSGPQLQNSDGIAVDGTRALVTDGNLAAILAVDLSSGDRTILSDAATGTGPNLAAPFAIIVDGVRALVLDSSLQAIVAVDLATGDRTILSDPATGTGPFFQISGGIALDGGRALVTDLLADAVFAVDLRRRATGPSSRTAPRARVRCSPSPWESWWRAAGHSSPISSRHRTGVSCSQSTSRAEIARSSRIRPFPRSRPTSSSRSASRCTKAELRPGGGHQLRRTRARPDLSVDLLLGQKVLLSK
jgi:hypothetical protein